MKQMMFKLFISSGFLLSLNSCYMLTQFEDKAAKINHYENAALTLAHENRQLQAEINRLQFEIEGLRSKNNYLQIQLDKAQKGDGKSQVKTGRQLASIQPVDPAKDLVKFDVYKWTPSQMIAIAEKEFQQKNFEKSAQFFHAFMIYFPEHNSIDDQLLFQAGLAAFEAGEHHDWTLKYLEKLIEEHPTSKFYRGAKLWTALTHLKQGRENKFFDTVEEFRKKYRNTEEWKILSHHYEKIVQKYKN